MKAIDLFIDRLSFKQLNNMLSGYLKESIENIEDHEINEMIEHEQEKLSIDDVTTLAREASLWAIANNIDLG